MKRPNPCIPIACIALTVIAAVSFGASTSATTSSSNPPPSARAVMDKFTRDILAILRDPAVSRPEKRAKVRDLAYTCMDFETFSRLALGQHWRGLSDDQHSALVLEIRKHLSATYGHTTDEYTDEDINITSDRQESNGDWTVLTRIVGTRDGTRKEIAKVDYRLRKSADAWKIIDVTIDGVSLMSNFRAQFQEIMTNGGIDKLLKLLRDKNAAAEQ
jgi:phospholipid transport system substrate-binding protein